VKASAAEIKTLGHSVQRKPPMRLFLKLFEAFLQWFYHCFDRIVINGYLSFLTREANVVYFFHDVRGEPVLTKELLRQRTDDYQRWVENYAIKNRIPILWAEAGVRKKDWLAPSCRAQQKAGRFGVYFILRSMEQGPTFAIRHPKFPTQDPNYRIVRTQRSRYTHFYFYILDPVAGPMVLRVGSFLPFNVTGYFNGHNFIERELIRRKIPYHKDDNRFISVGDPNALQAAANRLSGEMLQERMEHWTLILGPKFSLKERSQCGGLRRFYAVSQVEYCRNFIFKRSWPIQSIFRRSCELGAYLLTADRIAQLFGQRLTKRFKGKLQTVVERIEHGHHVLRTYCRNSFLKAYEKASTFLRLELVSNNVKDFRLRKTLSYWAHLRSYFQELTDRWVDTQAQHLNVHGQLDIVARLAKPVRQGHTKVAGIKLEHARVLRLLEVLLQKANGNLRTWTMAKLHRTILDQFSLKPADYTLLQLRYDLRKLRVHGLIERIPHTYYYRFHSTGLKQAILLVQLRRRIYGPLAFGLLRYRPSQQHSPDSRFERAYFKVEKSVDELIELLAA
jgi:hypothetical protein